MTGHGSAGIGGGRAKWDANTHVENSASSPARPHAHVRRNDKKAGGLEQQSPRRSGA
jgi:hypothetical protein